MTHVDDRIVLSLSRAREAASLLCNRLCRARHRHMEDDWVWPPPPHDESCIVPDIEARDALMAKDYEVRTISGDCQDPVKHGACSGCACSCHRHHNRPTKGTA